MRVLFISNLFPDQSEPWRGLDNASLLHALRRESPEISVRSLALRPSMSIRKRHWHAREIDQWTQPAYVPIPYLPKMGGLNHRLVAIAVERALKALQVQTHDHDLLLTPWLFPDACGVRMAPSLTPLPQLAIAQGSDVHRYLGMAMRRRAILQMLRTTEGVVTRSGDLAKRLINQGASAGRIHPVYNGVDTKSFCPGDQPKARAAVDLPADVPLALFVGNFLPVKGLDLLLEALALLHARGKTLHLALIGSGPLKGALEARASKLGVADLLHWRGRRSPAEVARHMQAADIVCLSSLNEGVPNVVLEAMAVGRPIVSTDVGGIHEVLGPQPSMHALVPSRDPEAYALELACIMDSPPAHDAIAAYGCKFSWQNCARQHLKLMETLIRSSSSTHSEISQHS